MSGDESVNVRVTENTVSYVRFCAELLGNIPLCETERNDGVDLFAEPIFSSEELGGVLMAKPLRLPRIAVVITTRCTLRCSHCAHLNSTYKDVQRGDESAENVIAAMRRVLSVCDVDFIALLGGEPFLHPDLPDIVFALRDEQRLGVVSITTNGTLPLSVRLIDALNHPKARVTISNYGDETAPASKALANALSENGLQYHVTDANHPWADVGGISPRKRSEDYLRGMYARCLFASCPAILGGKLYICPRHANAVNLGLVEDSGVNLLEDSETPQVLKRKIIESVYVREFVSTCNLCDFIAPDGSQTLIKRAT